MNGDTLPGKCYIHVTAMCLLRQIRVAFAAFSRLMPQNLGEGELLPNLLDQILETLRTADCCVLPFEFRVQRRVV